MAVEIGDAVILMWPGHAHDGKRHRVVSLWHDDYLGDMAELRRDRKAPDESDLSWMITALVAAGDAEYTEAIRQKRTERVAPKPGQTEMFE